MDIKTRIKQLEKRLEFIRETDPHTTTVFVTYGERWNYRCDIIVSLEAQITALRWAYTHHKIWTDYSTYKQFYGVDEPNTEE